MLLLAGCGEPAPRFEKLTKNQQEQAKVASDSLNETGVATSQEVPASGKIPDIAPAPKSGPKPVQENPMLAFVGQYEGVCIPKQGAPKETTEESLKKDFGKPTLVLEKNGTFRLHFLFDVAGHWTLAGTNFVLKAHSVNGTRVTPTGNLDFKGEKIPLSTFLEPKKITISNNGQALLDQPNDQPYIVLYRRK